MMCRTKGLLAAFLMALVGTQVASANPPAIPSRTNTFVFPKLPPLWRGVLCMVPGRYEQTIAICNEMLRSDPNDPYAHVLRGYAHCYKKNEDPQAIADFTEALCRGPDNAATHVARARAYGQAQDYDRAIADCTQAIRIDPSFGEAYAWRGASYLRKGVLNKAIADYSLALRHAPFLAWARCGRAEAYRRRGESARALADLEEVLCDDPENELALSYRLLVYLMNLHDYERVLAEASELIRRNPREPIWYMLRGQAYLVNQEITKALRDWTTAGTLKPGSLHLYCRRKNRSLFLGYYFGTSDASASGDNDPDERITACTKRLADDPNNVAAYYERACNYSCRREDKRAIADLDEILRRDPVDSTAYYERSLLNIELKSYAQALADCTKAVQIDPDNTDYYCARARIYVEQGRNQDAFRDLNHALELEPRIASAHVWRGWLYHKRKKDAAAIEDYSEAVRLSPVYGEAYLWRAWSYAGSGDYAEAIADFKKVLELDSQNVMAHRGLGWTLATCPDAKFRDGKEAQDHAKAACEATRWEDPINLDIFAAACAECGDFDQAMKWQTQALQLTAEEHKADYRKRLELYRTHKTYHAPRPPEVSASPSSK